MRSLRPSILLASILYATQISLALHLDFPRSSEAHLPNLLIRALNATSGLDILNGNSYYINITLGGKQFSVLIDTGSSDLWVAGTVPNANDTGKSAEIDYAIGSANGTVKTADLTMLGFTVPNQAFIEVTPSSTAPEGLGLVGLGPRTGSVVLATLNTSAADPPVDRIFTQNTSIPNFISVLLSRPNDTNETYTGEITISEILPEFQNISDQPKVPVTVLQSNHSGAQHFSVQLDPDGVIGPDGKAIKTTSNASLTPSHNESQLQVIFDTGFSFPQLPEYIVDAIYSGAKGAQLVDGPGSGKIWVVDCEAEINVTFKIGGQSYPVHPLDVTRQDTGPLGEKQCFGTFQSVIAGAQNPTFDAILGMTFLSNVYLLLDYGNFIDGTASNTSAPYAQLLSTTDPAEAHADFVATRVNGKDAGSRVKSFFQRHGIPIVVVAAVVGVVALAGVVWLVVRRRKHAYRPLHDPTPVGDMPMGHVKGYNSGDSYSDPWNSRK